MKKILTTALCLIGLTSSITAQEASDSEESVPPAEIGFYISAGAVFNGDYHINDRLAVAGLPDVAPIMPEVTIGYTISRQKYLLDAEVNAGYLNSNSVETSKKLTTTSVAVKLRAQHIPFTSENFSISLGADVSYLSSFINLYHTNNIDLNSVNLNYGGHITLNNEWFYAGPSLALGLFRTYDIPINLNMGYELALTNGYWTSNFADVQNSVKESGHSRFYIKMRVNF